MSAIERCPLITVRYIEVKLIEKLLPANQNKFECPLMRGVRYRACPLMRGSTVVY